VLRCLKLSKVHATPADNVFTGVQDAYAEGTAETPPLDWTKHGTSRWNLSTLHNRHSFLWSGALLTAEGAKLKRLTLPFNHDCLYVFGKKKKTSACYQRIWKIKNRISFTFRSPLFFHSPCKNFIQPAEVNHSPGFKFKKHCPVTHLKWMLHFMISYWELSAWNTPSHQSINHKNELNRKTGSTVLYLFVMTRPTIDGNVPVQRLVLKLIFNIVPRRSIWNCQIIVSF